MVQALLAHIWTLAWRNLSQLQRDNVMPATKVTYQTWFEEWHSSRLTAGVASNGYRSHFKDTIIRIKKKLLIR